MPLRLCASSVASTLSCLPAACTSMAHFMKVVLYRYLKITKIDAKNVKWYTIGTCFCCQSRLAAPYDGMAQVLIAATHVTECIMSIKSKQLLWFFAFFLVFEL